MADTTEPADQPEMGDRPAESGVEPDPQSEFKSEESKRAVLADLAKERDARQALEVRLKEFEDRDKTELQRLEERAAAAEKAAADRESALLRYRVATAKNLPADLVDRLKGDTEEELSADADALLALIPPRGARGAVDQGARDDQSTGSTSFNDVLRMAARGR